MYPFEYLQEEPRIHSGGVKNNYVIIIGPDSQVKSRKRSERSAEINTSAMTAKKDELEIME